jgi:hypothetical protein
MGIRSTNCRSAVQKERNHGLGPVAERADGTPPAHRDARLLFSPASHCARLWVRPDNRNHEAADRYGDPQSDGLTDSAQLQLAEGHGAQAASCPRREAPALQAGRRIPQLMERTDALGQRRSAWLPGGSGPGSTPLESAQGAIGREGLTARSAMSGSSPKASWPAGQGEYDHGVWGAGDSPGGEGRPAADSGMRSR